MLSFDPESVQLPPGHYIGGKHVQTQGDAFAVKRPSDGKVFATLGEARQRMLTMPS